MKEWESTEESRRKEVYVHVETARRRSPSLIHAPSVYGNITVTATTYGFVQLFPQLERIAVHNLGTCAKSLGNLIQMRSASNMTISTVRWENLKITTLLLLLLLLMMMIERAIIVCGHNHTLQPRRQFRVLRAA